MQTARKQVVAGAGSSRVTALSPAIPTPIASIERKEPSEQIAQSVRPSHDEIAKAAYLRWLKEGGDAETNWMEAERSLTRGDQN